jgi:hypothetical protein
VRAYLSSSSFQADFLLGKMLLRNRKGFLIQGQGSVTSFSLRNL